jgi:toxin ParE1/3/4
MKGIVLYTVRKWGPEQARRYIAGLQECFQLLAENPSLGRTCDFISSGLQRHEQDKHVVFYRKMRGGIRVIRVLHQQMLPTKGRFSA